MDQMAQQTFTMPTAPHLDWLRRKAAKEDRSMSWLIRKMIERAMAEEREAEAA